MASVHVDPRVERAAAYAWRLLVIGAATAAALWLVGRLLVVVLPLVVAVLIARALVPIVRWLRRRRVPRSAAAAIALVGFIAAVAAMVALVGASLADEVGALGPTLEEGIDDIETWLVEDSPFDLDQQRVEEIRAQIGERLSGALASSSSAAADTATVAAETVAGLVLALIVTFFFLKDHELIAATGIRVVREDRRPELRAWAVRAWRTLGGYLRGVAILGVVEATIIGFTVWIVGGRLVAAVVVVTLLGAFVPIVGAIVAASSPCW